MKEAEDIIMGKELGYTEYVQVSQANQPSLHSSPQKALFPSLDFKDAPIINNFNIVSAKKAQPLPTAHFK